MHYTVQIRLKVLNEKFRSFSDRNTVLIPLVIMIQHVVLSNHMRLLKVENDLSACILIAKFSRTCWTNYQCDFDCWISNICYWNSKSTRFFF